MLGVKSQKKVEIKWNLIDLAIDSFIAQFATISDLYWYSVGFSISNYFIYKWQLSLLKSKHMEPIEVVNNINWICKIANRLQGVKKSNSIQRTANLSQFIQIT